MQQKPFLYRGFTSDLAVKMQLSLSQTFHIHIKSKSIGKGGALRLNQGMKKKKKKISYLASEKKPDMMKEYFHVLLRFPRLDL